jgi:hypothetical protein
MELSTEILTNHVGYSPGAAKFCLMAGDKSQEFKVINTQTGVMEYQGTMQAAEGIFGKYLVGIFSDLKKEGTYRIVVEDKESFLFKISSNIYDDAMQKCVAYFSIQRCGPSTTGYAAPCHIDDGRRLDTGPGWPMEPYRDVSGGWHDAGDYRKWVAFTLYGMIGLCKVYELLEPEWGKEQILDELRWGNRYFLNMQNDAGYVMNYCGGDDGMYLSDNQIGTEDDRPIHTEPASFVHNNVDRTAQYNFIMAQALTGRIFRSSDPDYSKKCIDAAVLCLEWCNRNYYANTALEMGAGLMACVELYKTTEDIQFLEKAISFASRLLEIQVKTSIDNTYNIKGFFKTSSRDEEPSRHSWHGPQHIIGLCMLYKIVPGHDNAPEWKEAVRLFCEDYVLKLAELNNFNLAPAGLYLSDNPGGDHKIGDYWVRYLNVTDNAWGGGVNANIASTGIGMLHASKILNNDKLKIYAQRQLDWIVGSNPLNASTAEEIGHNQPIRFINRTLNIPPLIPGAVMNGIGGTVQDQPHLKEGSWQNCEYWTPPTANTMWLMAELQRTLE